MIGLDSSKDNSEKIIEDVYSLIEGMMNIFLIVDVL